MDLSSKSQPLHVPAFEAPEGACDTHFHVFGSQDQFPVASRARYEPPVALLADYLEECEKLGIERMVFVQPSAYGTDNACMLAAMGEVDPAVRRGIVDVPESISDADLQKLHDNGVRGIRINTSPVAPYDANRVRELTPRVRLLAEKLEGMGWCLEFLGPAWLTRELMPLMRELEIDFIVDHMGMFRAEKGIGQPGFAEFLALAESPNCWIKLTGIYRMSAAPDFSDAAVLAQSLFGKAPDRLIWGSDYPHLSFVERADTVALFNLLAEWFPRPEDRRRILADNPARLFGFE